MSVETPLEGKNCFYFRRGNIKLKMFDHTARMGVPAKSPTSEMVGPTTYIICEKKPPSKIKNLQLFSLNVFKVKFDITVW